MNTTTTVVQNHTKIDSLSYRDELFPYATLIFSCVTLLSCLVGAFGNALSIMIYSSRSMRRSSINSLLAGLSAVDLALTVLAILVFVLPGLNLYLSNAGLTYFYITITCALYQCVLITQTCSVWSFVLISIERYIAVCYPLRTKQILSVNRARCAQMIVFLAAMLYNSVRFFEYEPDPDDVGVRKLLLSSRTYFISYYVISYLITHCFGPFVIIFVLNLLILRTIKKGATVRRKESCRKNQAQQRTTRMIVVVTSIFALSNILPYVINIWEAVKSDLFEADDIWSLLASFILDASNTLTVLNSSINFIVYLCYCEKYKQLFLAYCVSLLKCTSRSSYSRRFASFDSYFSTVELHDFYKCVDGSTVIPMKYGRSHSDTTSDHQSAPIREKKSILKPIPRHCITVNSARVRSGNGSIVSAHILVNGSIRAAVLASRKSV